MTRLVWPQPEELGGYYDVFLKMAIGTAIVMEECQHMGWYLDLERFSFVHAVTPDRNVDVLSFVELFYHGLAACDLELHMIIRNAMYMF